MIKIAVNSLPLKNANKYRGVGYYTNYLIEELKKDGELEVQEFTDLTEVKNADLVHYPWFDLFFHTLPIRKKIPTVVTIHDVMPLLFPANYPLGFRGKINFILQKVALKSCKFIITDSVPSKEDIKKYLKVSDEKISVISLAVDSKFRIINNDTDLIFIKRKYRLPDQFLLFVGDANWVKNLPFLIKGFSELIKDSSFSNIKLILVGGVFLKDVENINHPELESLKEVNRLIKQYNLSDYIIKPGQIEDDELVAFYNLATLYIQPSFYEGFGLPILQAFACGAPVLTSNKGSLKEVGGSAAVYFDPNNLEQFISLAQGLLKDISLRTKLSKLGIEQAKKFSWAKVAEETKLIYKKAIEND